MINENENIQDPEMNNSEENVEQGTSATEELTNKLNESNDKYARLVAEFDNYKKRTAKEKIDLMQSAGKDVILKLLPVVDDFDRSLSFMKDVPEDDPMKQGIDLVYHK
jgi:molecular chaperone GrpE